MKEDLFVGFPYTTAKTWLAQITKDLKGRSPADMHWSPDGALDVNPYVHAEDVQQSTQQLSSFGKWQIGESFIVNDAHKSNRQILEALQGGTESLHIICTDAVKWDHLFAGVELQLIHIGLAVKGDVRRTLDDFLAYAGTDTRITVFSSHIPGYHDVRFCSKPTATDHVTDGLVAILSDALDSTVGNPQQLMQQDLSVDIGMHYLVEIARLRALRILWTDLTSALQFSQSPAFAIEAHTRAHSPGDDAHSHLIRSTIMAVAAILGGADRVYITPAMGGDHPESFHRHVGRNIHHLLRYECKLSEISDPVAGAYYLDMLTKDIIEKVWENVLKKIKKSGR